jgi:hypothetical protein
MLKPIKTKTARASGNFLTSRIRQSRVIGTRLACKGSRHCSKIAEIAAN